MNLEYLESQAMLKEIEAPILKKKKRRKKSTPKNDNSFVIYSRRFKAVLFSYFSGTQKVFMFQVALCQEKTEKLKIPLSNLICISIR